MLDDEAKPEFLAAYTNGGTVMFELKGIYCPIATPFINNEIAYDKLDENLAFWTASKLEGITVMGSNGEFVSLRESEKEALIRHCGKAIAGKKRFVVGTGSNCMDETLYLCNVSADCGADAVLLVTPFYYKGAMKDDVLERYYTAVADRSPLPVIIYNMPANTGVNTSSQLLAKLSHHPNIVGVKDTSGNIVQITETIRDSAPGFSVLAGNWAFLLTSLYMGAKGGTLALSNILPNECAELIELFEAGKAEEAKQLAWRLMPVNAAVTTKYGIGGLKVAMDYVGLYGGEPRLPLCRPGAEVREYIRSTLVNAGVAVRDIE
ncbi:MAG: dihydrodipicolinate synthase family protein [Christensenellales bacterium]